MIGSRQFGPGTAAGSTPPTHCDEPLPRTALSVVQGSPRYLEAHLRRLEAGALASGQPVAWLLGLQRALEVWLAAEVPSEDAALHLVLDPGHGWVSARLEPLPVAPRPYRLVVLSHPLGGRQADPTVVHKGLAGPWALDILTTVRQHGAEDALLLWPDGSLAETAIASVGIEFAGSLWIPHAPGRVASLTERLELPAWAASRNLQITMAEVPLSLARQGQVWCMNALRGIWPADLL